jgi:hypothetical protein
MPRIYNPTTENISFGGCLIKAEAETDIDFYLPPDIMSRVTVVDDEPQVKGPLIAATQVADGTFDIPYDVGYIFVNIVAQGDCTFSFGGVSVSLAGGEIYKTLPMRWERLGKVTVTGTAYVVVERSW